MLAALSLAGCAAEQSRYPSLAPRATEKIGFAEPVVKASPMVADPALDAKLAALSVRLVAITKGFADDAAKADKAAGDASGQQAGSERWIAAQTALASLDDWRAQASAIITDVEQLAIDRAATLAPDYPGIADLRDRTQTEVARETATIARLSASLSGG